MAQINKGNNDLYWLYITGFFIILALPALNIPPWFTPASYTQAIAFRSILAILGFIYLVRDRVGFQKLKNGPVIALLGYFLMVLISTLFSLDVSNSLWGTPARGAGFINFAFLMFFCIMTFTVVKDKDWKKLLDFSLFIGFLVGLIATFQRFSIFTSFINATTYRPSSTLGNPIILALYLLPPLFLSLSFFTKEGNKIKKYLYLFLVIFYSFVLIFLTQTRAAILGLLIGFFWFLISYPEKIKIGRISVDLSTKIVKIGIIVLPIIFVIFIFFLGAYPQLYEKWPVFVKEPVVRVVSLTQGVNIDQSRTSAWKISISAFLEKPYFGYGPENFYIAFNKHYDPTLPAMEIERDFDRAHNYLIQTLIDSGIFALIFYFAFFFYMLWGLQKIKKKYPIAHGLQAGFIAFFIAGLASIDGFAIMLVFFLFSAYSLHLISLNSEKKNPSSPFGAAQDKGSWEVKNRFKFIKIPALIILFFILVIFLWQYNFVILQINSQIVIAQTLQNSDWSAASKILEEQSKIKTLLLPYANSIYLNFLIDRIIYHSEEEAAISGKIKEISEKNTLLNPYDYKNWLRLGESLATEAKDTKDPEIIKKSYDAFNKALALSPKDPSILFSFFMADVSLDDLKGAKEKSDYCLKTFPESKECLWMSGLINIHLGDVKTGKEFIVKARENGYHTQEEVPLRQLVASYLKTKNYKEMLPLYQKLSEVNPGQVQYKTSLMIVYKELGDYQMSRQIALETIKSNPELKDQIENFLNTF